MRKIIIFLIICSIILGIFGFWYYQRNFYSKEILKLEILGKNEVELGEKVEYIVKYKNNGNVRLEEPRLIFEYPKYSIVEGENFLRKEIELEDIYPGQEKIYRFSARIFGKENEAVEAKAWLSFRPKNLKARYETTTTYTTIIKKIPLTFEFDLPSKVESGKKIEFRLNYFSNVTYPLSNLRVKIEYPSDFEFIEARPEALEKTEWDIPLLNKTEGGRIEISGILRGAVGEQKIFRANLGLWREGEFVLLKEIIRGVAISQPALYITQIINGNPQYIASPGDNLHYEIFFKNLSQEAMPNLFLIVNLDGKAFDFESLKSDTGDFKPGDNSIVFDWKRNPKLQLLLPQEEGKVDFWIKLKDDLPFSGEQDKNQVIKTNCYLSQVREEFETKLNSKLEMVAKAYYQPEVFENSGPIPPKIGETTTYTIVWELKNYFNDVKNVKVKAILPPQVKLTGKILPENSRFLFDSQSREIVWEVGDMEAGKGILNPPSSVTFQIALTPTSEQAGVSPLVGEGKISGEDQFTGAIIESRSPELDVNLTNGEIIIKEIKEIE